MITVEQWRQLPAQDRWVTSPVMVVAAVAGVLSALDGEWAWTFGHLFAAATFYGQLQLELARLREDRLRRRVMELGADMRQLYRALPRSARPWAGER